MVQNLWGRKLSQIGRKCIWFSRVKLSWNATPPNVAEETFVNFNRISKVYLCTIFNIELCSVSPWHSGAWSQLQTYSRAFTLSSFWLLAVCKNFCWSQGSYALHRDIRYSCVDVVHMKRPLLLYGKCCTIPHGYTIEDCDWLPHVER